MDSSVVLVLMGIAAVVALLARRPEKTERAPVPVRVEDDDERARR